MVVFIEEFATSEIQSKTNRAVYQCAAAKVLHQRRFVFCFCLSIMDIPEDWLEALIHLLDTCKAANSRTLYDIPTMIRSYITRSLQEFRVGNTAQQQVCSILYL